MDFASAVRYCRNLTEGGFTDWMLPTMAQLWSVYGLGAVSNDTSTLSIWTTTISPINQNCKLYTRLSDGYQNQTTATSSVRTRCVR